MSQSVRHLYEFGPFRLDATERLLLRDEHHIPLTPKAFETLLVLVEHGGHVIDKDELMKKVWPDTFVEEVNLAKNVSNLRKILGAEQAEHYIETIPKRGYRFVVGVREVWAEEPAPIPVPIIEERNFSSPHITSDSGNEIHTGVEGSLNGKSALATADPVSDSPAMAASPRKRSAASKFGLPLLFVILGAIVPIGLWGFLLRPTPKPPVPLLK